MPTRELSLAVVGADFPNKRGPGRRFEIQICAPGEPVELIPEPKNPADPLAIAVFSVRGVQIGYLKAERAPWIGGMMRAGEDITAIFQEATSFGGAIRAGINCVPTLPVARPVAPSPTADPANQEPEQDWWPDPEPDYE